MTRSALLGCALAIAVVVQTSPAIAAPTEADRLFDEGIALLDAGKFDEACTKLEASQRAEAAAGTLLALGDCLAKAGKTASALKTFREAGEFARRVGDAPRVRAADSRAELLVPVVPSLKIEVTAEPPVTVRRDGNVIEPSQWGVAVPLDPASYALDASSPGRVTWSKQVDLRGAGTTTITVPKLALAPAPAAQRPPAVDEGTGWSMRRKAALATGAVGVIALGIGGVFGVKASSTWSDAKAACRGDGDVTCPTSRDTELARSAGAQADVATAFVIGGVVALGAAVVLWLTDAR